MESNLNYPETPGFKTSGTSQEAASDISDAAKNLRKDVFTLLTNGGPYTADECAAILGKSILAIRPRLSELWKHGYIIKTKIRRKNASGKSAICWAIA